jgi:ABC-2 type transport system ATP-binding protein
MSVLQVNGLTKVYGNITVLDHVSFCLESGHIYGFVGNNGAGKTTLIRIITGLARQTSGSYSLLNAESEKDIMKARSRIGALVESPIFYPDMSARQNLIMQSKVRGVTDKRQIDELLRMVRLDSRTSKKIMRNYSTGMKQRYGLAFALLGSPEFLILDEPLNGLDVSGMDDISALLSSLNRENGTTILLSSHILSRLHMLATDYIFIDYGKIIECITAQELDLKTGSRDSELENYFRSLVRRDFHGDK